MVFLEGVRLPLVKLTDFWSCIPKGKRIWEWLGTNSPREAVPEDFRPPYSNPPPMVRPGGLPALSTQVWPDGRLSLLVTWSSSTTVKEKASPLCSLNCRCLPRISLDCYLIPLSFNSCECAFSSLGCELWEDRSKYLGSALILVGVVNWSIDWMQWCTCILSQKDTVTAGVGVCRLSNL